MDIMLPTLERQSAPALRRLVQQQTDRRALVENIRSERPGATADSVAALLAGAGVEASGSWVAHWLRQPPSLPRSTWPRIALPTDLSGDQKVGDNGEQWNSVAHPMTAATERPPKSDRSVPVYPMKQRRGHLLNRFIETLYYSLARYLQEARPWIGPGDEPLWERIQQVASDQEAFALRAARLLSSRRKLVTTGRYPSQYGHYNDLAVHYVAHQLILEQSKLLDELECCLRGLADDHEASDIVRAALASQRRLSNELERALQAPSVPERDESPMTRVPDRIATNERMELAPRSHTKAMPVTAA